MSKKISQQFLCSKMMLPEHCAGLKEYAAGKQWAENHRRPDIDQQMHEELQRTLEQALVKQESLKITILNDSGYRTYSGIPVHSDPASGLICLQNGRNRPKTVKAAEVVRIERG